MDEEDVVLEAGVEMWFESQVVDNRVVMAIHMRVDSVKTFEHLTDQAGECLWKCDPYKAVNARKTIWQCIWCSKAERHLELVVKWTVEMTYQCGLERVTHCQCCFDTKTSSAQCIRVQTSWWVS